MAWLSGMLCSWDKELWAERQLVKALYFPSTHHTWAAIWFTLYFRLLQQPENRQAIARAWAVMKLKGKIWEGPAHKSRHWLPWAVSLCLPVCTLVYV